MSFSKGSLGITKYQLVRVGFIISLICLLQACSDSSLNNPYPQKDATANILYSSFAERPKYLDPIKSYSSNEYAFLGQVYEPSLQYHYLKRPYELIPLTATKMPQVIFLDKRGQELPADTAVNKIAYSQFNVSIQKGIQYQPHPGFAKDAQGDYLYHALGKKQFDSITTLDDFEQTGFRELVAADYAYQIKRLAHPKINSPIYGLMRKYIVGLDAYAKKLKTAYKEQRKQKPNQHYLDLHQYDFDGVKVIDRYTYRITIKGVYPQFMYWLAMPFFAAIPHEVDKFYSQPGMKKRNISFDWYPVGTGPFMLTKNNPNFKMVLERNPNFRGIAYPADGSDGDKERGLLADAGKMMPFIDKAIYSLEKESIPRWSKFLQGYYDNSGIGSDSFDQAVQFSATGNAALTSTMQQKGIKLVTATNSSTSYMGFNMLDPVVGGYTERARYLRQAISIAFDYEEYISIFINGRGIPAQGAIPPGIFGYQQGEDGVNPVVYKWNGEEPVRRSLDEAKALLAKAGYENGIDKSTNKPLLIYFDAVGGGAEDKSMFDFLRKQFSKLNLSLIVRNTDYNRFQEKMLKGNAQIFRWGWNADYPDPENFLFLLYGPNSKVKHQGENAANYNNPEYDRLFEKMETMPNSPERLRIIKKMLSILREDSPWLWGYHPQSFSLYHSWYFNAKPNLMAHNTLMYKRIDPQKRAELRLQWNKAVYWPIVLLVVGLIIIIIPAWRMYSSKESFKHK
ncbi:ABC transporter, substrate-binding protein (cluster 5, nickel/peptides/opines) [hydrothermal vent metagenome]|uniref:ABC transporter, substrate-binding protein (Cluster 5, nickel/peptides/opines) n=1 Tax=hydrothermal vent metagenome TaxID=652676 RepID=A0A3B1AFR0_9ZZZZ